MQACYDAQSYTPLAQGQTTTDKYDLAALLALSGSPESQGAPSCGI